MNTFEKWWDEHYEKPLANVGGALKLSYKEIAKEAWNKAFTIGYHKGVENAEYDDTK